MPIEEIQGYQEFQRDTAKIEKALPEAMAQASQDFARDWVNAAQANANTAFAHDATQSFIVSSGEGGAVISNTSPVFFGSEFGGRARPETMQFPPYNGKQGYWFYPARRENQDRLDQIWDKAIQLAMNEWNRHA